MTLADIPYAPLIPPADRTPQMQADFDTLDEMMLLLDGMQEKASKLRNRNTVVGKIFQRLDVLWVDLIAAALVVEE